MFRSHVHERVNSCQKDDDLLFCECVALFAARSNLMHTSFIAVSVIVARSGSFGWRGTAMKGPIQGSPRNVGPSAPTVLKVTPRVLRYLVCEIFQMSNYTNLRLKGQDMKYSYVTKFDIQGDIK